MVKKGYIRNLFIICAGIVISAIGIQIIVLADQGVDSISTLIMGLMNYIPISFGHWSGLLSLVFFVITLTTYPKVIGVATVIYVLLMGNMLHFLGMVTAGISFSEFSNGMLLIGYLMYGIGISIYLNVGLGAGPLEGIMLLLVAKTPLTVRTARILLDSLFVLTGVILGGKLGVGTIIGVVCMGPIIDFFLKLFKKRIHSLRS
jgi:hypothetical protein